MYLSEVIPSLLENGIYSLVTVTYYITLGFTYLEQICLTFLQLFMNKSRTLVARKDLQMCSRDSNYNCINLLHQCF